MDVRLPDGTMVRNVPDGISKADLTEKLKANGFDVSGLEPKAEAQPVSGKERVAATSGGLNKGLASLAGLPVDTVENIVNLGIAAFGKATGTTPDLLKGSFGGAESIGKGLESAGFNTQNPRPDDAASRMLHTAGTIVGGSMVPGARPLPTAAAAASGAVAGETLGPQWVAPASLAPAAAVQGAQGIKQSIANRVDPRVDQFKTAGAYPSVGQATEFNFLQGFENLLSKFPGGQGVFRKFAENQQKQLGEPTKTGVAAEDAGRSIEKGVSGFLGRTKEEWQKLDYAVAQKIPVGTALPPANTVKVLDDLTASVAGAENTTKGLANPVLQKMRDNMATDLQASNGQMPFEALRKLRTKIGSMLDDSLVSGVPGGELKKLYGAISKDLESAANQAGAGQEFSRQSNYYKARMERIEGVLDRVIGNTPEETFKRFMPTDPDQATKVRGVMRSLDPGQRKVVTDAIVSRLGRAAPGKQDAAGDIFSPESFLTNWNRLSPGAKGQIFPDPSMRKNMDALAGVTENLRSGAKVFANPSGSAGAAAPYGMGYLLAVGNIATVGTLAGGAMIGAKMLTSPTIVEWLAKAPNIKPGQELSHLARLGVIYNETKDQELKQELGTYLKSVSASQ